MRTINRKIVAAVIISSDNKLFMGKKDPKKGGVYLGCWHIPGGGIDKGESNEDALQREIREETGIDISNAKTWIIDDKGKGSSKKTLSSGESVFVGMTFLVYGVHLDQKAQDINLKLDDDLAEGAWFAKEDLANIKLTPPTIELIDRVGLSALYQAQ